MEREGGREREREREKFSHTAPSALTPAAPTLTTDVCALTTGAAANDISVVAAAVAAGSHVEGGGGGGGASCHIAEPALKRLKT